MGIFNNQGQVCNAGSRLIVEEAVRAFDQLKAKHLAHELVRLLDLRGRPVRGSVAAPIVPQRENAWRALSAALKYSTWPGFST